MSITLYVKLKKKKRGGGEQQQEGAGLGRLDGLSGYMVGSGADVTLQPCLCQSGQMFKGNCRAPHGGGHSCSVHVDAKPSTTQDKCQLQICCSVGDSKQPDSIKDICT